MAVNVLDYFARAVPVVVQKAIATYYMKDPLFKALLSKRRINLQGGPQVRIPRVIGGHSSAVEISATNMRVPISGEPVLDTLSFDWGMYAQPIVIPHWNRWRANTPADFQAMLKDTTMAALSSFKRNVSKHIYFGNTTQANGVSFSRLGTLNGLTTGLASLGLENGAIRFQTPSAQAAAAVTYLGGTRSLDTGAYNANNWFNQYAAHNGVNVDFFDAVELVKMQADSFCDESEDEGITLGLCGTDTARKISRAARLYPGTGVQAQVVLTLKDLEAGKAVPRVNAAAGVVFHPVRWMDTTLYSYSSAASLPTELAYLINPMAVSWHVNAGMDFRVGKWVNMLDANNTYADRCLVELQAQFTVDNLLKCGAVSQ